ncbi:hypothetical protein EVAR_56776_1 [Eumeta japonica]|uniref:Uncharacterized protein n=1 Tax=Eumeta variegata TaxID=151549 RepID=A0A4C1XQ98_EUMVA|nr:hypothetical protein EVAR_56776_1 [Eumeta japonica]
MDIKTIKRFVESSPRGVTAAALLPARPRAELTVVKVCSFVNAARTTRAAAARASSRPSNINENSPLSRGGVVEMHEVRACKSRERPASAAQKFYEYPQRFPKAKSHTTSDYGNSQNKPI